MKTERIRVRRPGGPERLHLETHDLSAPGPNEVQVAVEVAGVAFADVMVREGHYPNVSAPVTPGYDLVGRILAVGAGVPRQRVGDRVGALTVTGAYARHVNLPVAWAAPIPEALPASSAVALVLNYVTAHQMLLRNTALRRGDVALVHGGSGGVGSALLELCAQHGIRAWSTASAAKHDAVRQHGATPIDYRTEDFVARLRREGVAVDAAFDHLGGRHLRRSYDTLRPTGVLVSYGMMSAFPGGRTSWIDGLRGLLGQPRFRPLDLLLDNKTVVGFDIAGCRDARPDWFAEDLAALCAQAVAGTVVPVVDRVFPLAEAADAHRHLGEGRGVGKVVLDCAT
jgi:NADPH:quinone reductase-like Zn-dependent oxidoreductase